MNEKQYRDWWALHRRVVKGETLSAEENRAYEAGRAELEAEEWASLRNASVDWRPLQKRLRELTAQNQKLAQQEASLRERAVELEHQYLALTGENSALRSEWPILNTSKSAAPSPTLAATVASKKRLLARS